MIYGEHTTLMDVWGKTWMICQKVKGTLPWRINVRDMQQTSNYQAYLSQENLVLSAYLLYNLVYRQVEFKCERISVYEGMSE